MITPRQRFRDSAYAKGWLSLVDSNQFQEAASAALLEMQLANPSTQDHDIASAWHWRMDGAKQFLRIIMSLTEPTNNATDVARNNLDYGV